MEKPNNAAENGKEPAGKGGAPTKYDRSLLKMVYKLALLGATEAQIADFFEISIDSISEWKNVHPEFSATLKQGKLQADAEVAKSLFKRAKGYEYEEQTFEDVLEGRLDLTSGKPIHVPVTHVRTVRKVMPPDTAACKWWLMNRQPKQWRERIFEVPQGDGASFVLKVLPAETLKLPQNGNGKH